MDNTAEPIDYIVDELNEIAKDIAFLVNPHLPADDIITNHAAFDKLIKEAKNLTVEEVYRDGYSLILKLPNNLHGSILLLPEQNGMFEYAILDENLELIETEITPNQVWKYQTMDEIVELLEKTAKLGG